VTHPGQASQGKADGQVPLLELAAPIAAATVDAATWRAWLADRDTLRRFEALVYRRGAGQCAYWIGAISSTGHGKFRAGSRARARPGGEPSPPSRIVTAHVFAAQLHHDVITAPLASQVVIRHNCDETSCQNWEHLLIGTQAGNVSDYRDRRGREDGPLADRRGARGRAVAIRHAILTAQRSGADVEDALLQAIAAGIPPHRERLFLPEGWQNGAAMMTSRKPCSRRSPRASRHIENASSYRRAGRTARRPWLSTFPQLAQFPYNSWLRRNTVHRQRNGPEPI
jgi:hypothetical protein